MQVYPEHLQVAWALEQMPLRSSSSATSADPRQHAPMRRIKPWYVDGPTWDAPGEMSRVAQYC